MTPKEKAIELVLKFKQRTHYVEVWHTPQLLDKFHHNAISCALIAVDEIIEATSIKYEFRDAELFYAGKKPMQYWLDVKKEIEAL